MKKQISLLLIVFFSIYFLSSQKEAITPLEENSNSAAVSMDANLI